MPPAINQFSKVLDKNLGAPSPRLPTPSHESRLTRRLLPTTAQNLFKLLLKYRPEDKKEKKVRRLERARLLPSLPALLA